ncbi:MAG: calcineurin-like phosphoesterase C-terminal domain-containing protein, partial [Bacteroidales bacterium]|nr:calcineurin-like phosphoesterase C-terminal domain-containing protein [Bacteroidales bacterium]
LEEVGYFHKGMVSELIGVQGVDFGISMGDLVGDNLDLHKPYIEAVKDIGIPWHNVMGNHDENYDVKADSLSDETFERNFGPATYAFNHGKAHFIVIDDILYPDPRDGRGYWGGFRKDQLEFIKNDLSLVPKDHLIILAFHIPISELEGGDPFNDEDRQQLFELLSEYPHTLTLSAHTHFQSQDFFTTADGWLQQKSHHHYNVGASCGDWYSGRLEATGVPVSTMRDGTPKGYAFLNINTNQYTIDYKVAGQPSDFQIGIFAPKVVEQNRSTSAGIYANYYMGSVTDTLYCRIDDGPWKAMQYTYDYDPAYLHLLHEWDFAEILPDGRRPSNPVSCNHLWRTGVPTKLQEGEHMIEIKVTDMFGRIITQKSSYRIATR